MNDIDLQGGAVEYAEIPDHHWNHALFLSLTDQPLRHKAVRKQGLFQKVHHKLCCISVQV